MILSAKNRTFFKTIPCVIAGIFLCINLSSAPFLYAGDEANTKLLVQSSGVVIEQKISQSLKSAHLDDIGIKQEPIDLGKVIGAVNASQVKAASKNPSKAGFHPGISLRSNASAVSRPYKEKPTSRWINGKLSKPSSSVMPVTTNQSKELRNLQKQQKNRKSSFDKSLETNSTARNSLLLKQSDKKSEKDNE